MGANLLFLGFGVHFLSRKAEDFLEKSSQNQLSSFIAYDL